MGIKDGELKLADVVEVFQRTAGTSAAITIARERSGTQFDPALVDLFCDEADRVFAGLPPGSTWEAVIAAEPALSRTLSGGELDAALEAIANFTDLKSP